MWIAQNAVTSTTQPKNDATNWVEFKAPAGADGQNGVGIASVTSADGNVTITMTDNTSKTFYMKGDRGEQGEQGNPGRDGMQVQGSEGQTLVHNGTTWVATDQLSLNKLDVKPATTTEDALFEVKDKDGNVVFAVYPDGVHVYVDADATKAARRTGFVVTGRSGTKDGEALRRCFGQAGDDAGVEFLFAERHNNALPHAGALHHRDWNLVGERSGHGHGNDYLCEYCAVWHFLLIVGANLRLFVNEEQD